MRSPEVSSSRENAWDLLKSHQGMRAHEISGNCCKKLIAVVDCNFWFRFRFIIPCIYGWWSGSGTKNCCQQVLSSLRSQETFRQEFLPFFRRKEPGLTQIVNVLTMSRILFQHRLHCSVCCSRIELLMQSYDETVKNTLIYQYCTKGQIWRIVAINLITLMEFYMSYTCVVTWKFCSHYSFYSNVS